MSQFVNGVGLCLGVVGGSGSSGATVDQVTCSGTSDHSQFWANYANGGSTFHVVNGHSGYSMGVQGSSHSSGAYIVQGSWVGDPTQTWTEPAG